MALAVLVPVAMPKPKPKPKPDVTALTGGYRKTPTLQIGADVYCDTTLIAQVIDDLQHDPPLVPADEVMAYTDAADWPMPDTAALWARFRTEALSGGIQKWSVERYKRLLDIEAAPPAGLYRIFTDEDDGRTWLATPGYQRVTAFKKPAVDPKPSLLWGRLPGETKVVEVLRLGCGKLRWPPADA